MGKKAFVIGVNTLGLQYCVNDALLISEALKYYGYTVCTLTTGDKRGNIANLLDEFIDDCTKTDTLVFYFSGHGHLYKGKLELVLAKDISSISNRLPIDSIVDALEKCVAENKLIILDCCHASITHGGHIPNLSDSYRVLTASERLEKAKELESIEASFLTHNIYQELMDPSDMLLDKDHKIRINRLHDCLIKDAEHHNGLNNSIKVPIPNLLGNSKANFEIGTVVREHQQTNDTSIVQTLSKTPCRQSDKPQIIIQGDQAEARPPNSPIDFDWIKIPAGNFLMGSNIQLDSETKENEIPQCKIYLPEYWIARFPVTVAQFAHFVKVSEYQTTAEMEGKSEVWSSFGMKVIKGAYWRQPFGPDSHTLLKYDHPVTCISWYDAMAFCKWAGVRLSSEPEWEKAARGTSGNIYPWGNENVDNLLCNFQSSDTVSVEAYSDETSPFGAFNMSGNVWEWTRSLWGNWQRKPNYPYHYNATDGRENARAAQSILRVARGGSFSSPAYAVRAAFRGRFLPQHSSNHIGMRVVWSDS